MDAPSLLTSPTSSKFYRPSFNLPKVGSGLYFLLVYEMRITIFQSIRSVY